RLPPDQVDAAPPVPTAAQARAIEAAGKHGRVLTMLSGLIIALKLADVRLEKISIAGVDLSLQQPFVIVGTLGVVLLYLSIRYMSLIFRVATLHPLFWGGAIPKPQPGRWAEFGMWMIVYQLLDGATSALEFTLFIVALFLAWPEMRQLFDLVLQRAGEHPGFTTVALVPMG